MKKYVKTFVAGALILSVSACNSGSKTSENPSDTNQNIEMGVSAIDFKTAENYFVKNTVTNTVPAKITTQEEFDKYFGMATTMGENGKPTAIDFSKEYVIVIDHIQTKNKTEMVLSGVEKKREDIIVNYTVNEGEDAGYETRPFLMIIVDKNIEGNVVLNKQ